MGEVEHSFEPTPRRVRVRFGGADIAESQHALLMMGGYKPPLYELSNYYFPRARAHRPARGERPPLALRHAGRGHALDGARRRARGGWRGLEL